MAFACRATPQSHDGQILTPLHQRRTLSCGCETHTSHSKTISQPSRLTTTGTLAPMGPASHTNSRISFPASCQQTASRRRVACQPHSRQIAFPAGDQRTVPRRGATSRSRHTQIPALPHVRRFHTHDSCHTYGTREAPTHIATRTARHCGQFPKFRDIPRYASERTYHHIGIRGPSDRSGGRRA